MALVRFFDISDSIIEFKESDPLVRRFGFRIYLAHFYTGVRFDFRTPSTF